MIANENQTALGLDSLRPVVMNLVESWVFRKNFQMNKDEFAVFDSNQVAFKSVPTLMERYRNAGYDTLYVYGYEGKFYERKAIYGTLGFSHTLYQEDFAVQGLTGFSLIL